MSDYTDEQFEHAVDLVADIVGHEACDYTIKATYPEILAHLEEVRVAGPSLACDRRLVGQNWSDISPETLEAVAGDSRAVHSTRARARYELKRREKSMEAGRDHTFECWVSRGGTCREGCSCWCHRERGTGITQDGPEPRGGSVLGRTQAAVEALSDARDAYRSFQRAWRDVGHEMRKLDQWQWHRVEAYPGWDGLRDQGAGQSMLDWFEEVGRRLEEIEQD